MQAGDQDGIVNMQVDRSTGEVLTENLGGNGIPSVAKNKRAGNRWVGMLFFLPVVAAGAYVWTTEKGAEVDQTTTTEQLPAGFQQSRKDLDALLTRWTQDEASPQLEAHESQELKEKSTFGPPPFVPPPPPPPTTSNANDLVGNSDDIGEVEWNGGIPTRTMIDALALQSPLSPSNSGQTQSAKTEQPQDLYASPRNPYAESSRLESAVLNSLNNQPSARDHNEDFKRQVANREVERVYAEPLPNQDYTVLQGSYIHCALDTAIESTLPGDVSCTVTRDVYGMSGRIPLIRRGSKLSGKHNSDIRRGQGRVFVVWSRLVTPEGSQLPIGSSGADNLGRAGFSGEVDTHFWERFGNATLLSLLGATLSTAGVDGSDQANASSAYRQAITMSFQTSSSRSLEHNMDIPDTIYKDQGETVIIFVNRDLDFSQVVASNGRYAK